MKVVDINKMSKKARREFYKGYRVTWGFNPVTRSPRNRKKYYRPEAKAALRRTAEQTV